jgi:hypothetical protein
MISFRVFEIYGFPYLFMWIHVLDFGVLEVFTCRARVIAYSHAMFSLCTRIYICDHFIFIHACSCIMIYPVRVDLGVDIICIASRASFHEAC